MVYNVEKMLRENGDKISGSERGDVENAIADAKKALESNDKRPDGPGARAADAGFAQTGGTDVSRGPATGQPVRGRRRASLMARAKPDDGVVDAEYIDVDDRKSA